MKFIEAKSTEDNRNGWQCGLTCKIDGAVAIGSCPYCGKEVIAEDLNKYKYCPFCGECVADCKK